MMVDGVGVRSILSVIRGVGLFVLVVQVIDRCGEMVDVDFMKHIFCF